MSPTLADDFVIEKLLGHGGMGTVHAALQRSTGRRVAIKLLPADALDDERIARFDREAAALSRLSHPNIVHIYTHGRDPQGRPFLAMELVEGRTLQAVLAQEGPLDVGRAVTLAAQIVEGLAYAHERHIAHRDVKPSNVMVARLLDRELVKLVDFGLAKLLDDSLVAGTASGRLLGSAPYMSPEQWNQLRDIDGRADIYSFGCVLYEMLTGRPPFVATGMVGYLKAHLAGVQVPPTQLRPELADHPEVLGILARTMASDRAQRPQTARALLAELRPLELRYRAALAPLPPVPPAPPLAPATAPTMSSSGGLGSGWVSNVATDPVPSVASMRRRAFAIPVSAALASVAAAVVLALPSGPESSAPPAVAETTLSASVAAQPPESPDAVEPDVFEPDAVENTEAEPATLMVAEADVIEEPAPAPRAVRLDSRPPGARVIYDGYSHGRTPLELPLRAGAPNRVTLKLRGYLPRVLELDPSAGDPPVVTLRAARRRGPPPSQPPDVAPSLNLDRLPIK